MYDSRCDVSCILSSFKGHNFTLYYVRAAISVLHDLPKIASIYSLNGRASLSQKRLDPAKCKKYDHYKIKEPQKSISLLHFNSPSRANSAVLF